MLIRITTTSGAHLTVEDVASVEMERVCPCCDQVFRTKDLRQVYVNAAHVERMVKRRRIIKDSSLKFATPR